MNQLCLPLQLEGRHGFFVPDLFILRCISKLKQSQKLHANM